MSTSVKLENVTKKFGDFTAVESMTLHIGDGEFFSLLGPSGCGKTTTLRMVAGFEQPTDGRIFIMDEQVAGIPAYRRPVNTVFQNYALFPHMNVSQNVAFGLQMAKVAKDEITRRVKDALELVQMGAFSERRPRQLSGGQKQRVALARALVNRPRVLLLDEPLGALDLKLRKEMQLELKQIQSEVGITFIYVTHDQEEAITMSDRIAVMHDGFVKQVGSSREIYEQPANRFVADFIGETNFIEGNVVDSAELTTLTSNGITFSGQSQRKLASGTAAALAIRPEKIWLLPENAASSNGRVSIKGTVSDVIYIGTDNRYQVELATGDKVFVRVQNLGAEQEQTFSRGSAVSVQFSAENARVLTE
ncbi:MAG: ABC transporter ATP-binding protein [Candidatus Promineifilaceae bacterium]